ncbi:MAG: PorV/PorQ family protein, partial [Flavobacteriales bacterium]
MKNHFFAFFFCFSVLSFAQTGGTSFAVLNQNFDARSIALGGNAMLAWDAGVGKALWNPALLNKEMYNRFSYDHTTYPASIQLNQLSYSRWNSKLEIQQSYSIQQASYGDMKRTLENGVVEGEFTPRDLIFQAGASKKLNELLQIGVQPKFIFSDLGDYSSTGFYMDFSGVYTSKNERVLASVLVRNAGFVLSKFSENTTYASPLEIQMSVSNRFEHMPLRWMIS